MELPFLDHLVKDVGRFGGVLVLDAFAFEAICIYSKRAHRGSSRRRATDKQETEMLVAWRRGEEQHKTSIEAEASSKAVRHFWLPSLMKESTKVLQLICYMCLNKFIRHVAGAKIRKERSNSVITLLNRFSSMALKRWIH